MPVSISIIKRQIKEVNRSSPLLVLDTQHWIKLTRGIEKHFLCL